MAVFFDSNENYLPISLGDFIEYARNNIDSDDADSIMDLAPIMQRLSLDVSWLAKEIDQSLKDSYKSNRDTKFYGSNIVFSRHYPEFALRAVVWDPSGKGMVKKSREQMFAENFYHDHDFHLLTVGLLGDGYITDMYNYNKRKTLKLNEKIDVYHDGIYQLKKGTALFMRENHDIHAQSIPKKFSVSFNLIVKKIQKNQYAFNISDNKKSAHVKEIIDIREKKTTLNLIELLRLSSSLKDANLKDTLNEQVGK